MPLQMTVIYIFSLGMFFVCFVYLFDLGAFQPGTAHPGAVRGMTAMLTYSEACTLGAVRF